VLYRRRDRVLRDLYKMSDEQVLRELIEPA
jgi:hypothetical protein